MNLDPLIHAPTRLAIVSLLAAVDEAEFAFVRDQLEISDSVLSKHIGTLEAAHYVEVRKGHVGKRPRTWLKLTQHGHVAFTSYVDTLRGILNRPLG
ncbi:transcriptional regulator [Kutzneria viridogrisea]|uniref:Winged helix DNA-binding domain-containing protein n=2 Tax=Kutzneria TaxID=43356 RepID=W5WIZ6_9PSEU|nr:transcriptional regulator [Kutzneria albida]AHI01154.1 hypothetical protein KALB_7796 [Kutzneria albida DSM 43870]MBA8926408.1 DNA-binding transcriptional ArsR family regulator [Kutzneria viridogrisea]